MRTAFSGWIRSEAKGETQYWAGAAWERVPKVIIVFLDLQPVRLDDSSMGQVVKKCRRRKSESELHANDAGGQFASRKEEKADRPSITDSSGGSGGVRQCII
ncbi:hypothetical protein QTP88_003424 [Uroleucon formosanum]